MSLGFAPEKIIEAVRSPLGLLTVMVLVAEGLLFLLADKAQGNDFTIIVVGMIAVIPLVLLVLYLRPDLFQSENKVRRRSGFNYDAFISTPMAAYSDNHKYEKQRSEIIKIKNALKSECKYKNIFYAGTEISDVENFEANDISLKSDLEALYSSKNLIFVYPEKLPSGALVEVGAAIAMKVPSIFFVPSRKGLPFILEQADTVYDFIKIYEVNSADKIVQLLQTHGCAILPNK